MIIPNLLILNNFSNMGHAELRKAEKAPMNGERTGRGERELRGRGRGVGEAPMSPLSRQTTSAWEPVRRVNSN